LPEVLTVLTVYEKLLDRLVKEKLTLERHTLSDTLAAVSYPDYRTIVMDKHVDSARAVDLLAHELGHHYTGAYYSLDTPLQTWGRCEAKADAWMVKALCPLKRLKAAIRDGCRTYYELSEELDVSEDVIRKAIDYYTRRGLM
jgi:Zn-dependent peptidase ImmA (M78 family)